MSSPVDFRNTCVYMSFFLDQCPHNMKHMSTFSKYNNIKLTRCRHHWVHFSDGTFKSFWTNAHTTKHMSTFSKYNNIKLTRCRHHWVHFSDGTFKSFWTNAHTTKHMSTFSKYNNIKLTLCPI